MNRDSIQVATSGERPLSHEELTSAFYSLLRRMDQEEAFTSQICEAFTRSADLADQAGEPSEQSTVAVALMPPKIKQLEAEIRKSMIGLQNIGEAVVGCDKSPRD